MIKPIARTCALILSLAGVTLLTAGAGKAQAASNINNACAIFQEKTAWHNAAMEVSEKRNVPVPVILAVMHQESRFKAAAAASTSTAYGFAQVLDGTWNWYRKATKADTADRTSFADSADFIAWYMLQTQKKVGLPLHDVASHYIAYHEGHGGYRSTRWADDTRLINVAHKVASIAAKYEEQLHSCGLVRRASHGPTATPTPVSKPFALASVRAVTPRRKPIDALYAEVDTSLLPGFAAVRWQ